MVTDQQPYRPRHARPVLGRPATGVAPAPLPTAVVDLVRQLDDLDDALRTAATPVWFDQVWPPVQKIFPAGVDNPAGVG